MKCISLIGMPGAGKSTLGIQLAKETARDFIDTDVLIQLREGKTLQQIMDEVGYLNLRLIEEQVLLCLQLEHHVIATGGSAVYSKDGMQLLKDLGAIVYLDVPIDELKSRIKNYENRGISRSDNQSFEALYKERGRLYRKYADITVCCNGKDQSQILEELKLCL